MKHNSDNDTTTATTLRTSLSDSDLATGLISNNNGRPNQTSSLSRDLEILILDDNQVDNLSENLNNENDDQNGENDLNLFDNNKTIKSKKQSKNKLFLLKKRKWLSSQIGLITKCFMARNDSNVDLPQINSVDNSENIEQNPQLNNSNMDQQQSINDNDDDIVDGDANRINNDIDDDDDDDDDDLSFMQNFPPINQPLSRIVSLRRRHPNTPMSRSPEPPPIPIPIPSLPSSLLSSSSLHPFPVAVAVGFTANSSYLHHPQISSSSSSSSNDNHIASISSVVNSNSGASTPRDNNDHQHDHDHQHRQLLYEQYSIQMPLLNHHHHISTTIVDHHNMNRSTSSSTPTFHTQIDYINCLVPDLLAITNRSFYWGKMDRYKAERLLDGKPEGTFLLRDSAQEDHLFSVSFRRFERSLHARIENWEHRFSFDSHDPGVFSSPTVTGLIEHYKIPSHCMFFEPVLTKPLNRTFTFSLQHLARVTICDRVTYDSINRLPLPQILKSYLKEYHYRIKVRTRHFDESSSSLLCRWLESNYQRNNSNNNHNVSIFTNDESIN